MGEISRLKEEVKHYKMMYENVLSLLEVKVDLNRNTVKIKQKNGKQKKLKKEIVLKTKVENVTLSLGRFSTVEEMEEWKAEFKIFVKDSDETDRFKLRDLFFIEKTGEPFQPYKHKFHYK